MPLDQDRALVRAFDERALAGALVGDQQAHRALHPQEPVGRHRHRPGQEAFDQRFAEAEALDRLVHQPHQVVLGVPERLGGNGAGVGNRVAPLLDGEAERVAQHLRQVVPHQERLVLVHREPGVPLAGVQRQAKPTLRDPLAAHEFGQLVRDAQPRVLQVDRIDRVIRDGHLDLVPRHHVLAVEADHPRVAAPRAPGVHPVEVHEADRLIRPVGVGHARPQAGGDEGQVRIGVLRLHLALLGGEFDAAVEAVVLVIGALGEDRAKRLDVGGHARLLDQARGDAAVQEPGRRVRGPVEALRVGGQRRAVRGGHESPEVHHVESGPRDDVEFEVERFAPHARLGEAQV